MKRIFLVLLGMLSATSTLACSPGGGGGPSGDPNCMGGVLHSDPNYYGGRNPTPTRIEHITINVPPKFGALAFDSTTATAGSAYDADTKEQAIKDALRSCSDGGKNKHCELMVWVRNGCIAGADGTTKSGGGKFYPVIGLPGEAEAKALKKCQKNRSLTDCHIVFKEMRSLS